MYYNVDDKFEMECNTKCIVKCNGFCEEGYAFAVWNGRKFYSSMDFNEEIDKYVKKFLPLTHNGNPFRLEDL